MNYILIIALALGSVTASCQKEPVRVNYPEELSEKDSIFIDNVLKVCEPDYIDADAMYVEKHIELYVAFEDYSRIYYLSHDGRIETMLEFYPDGKFINYGEESQ
jgi:hypothetical protein